MKETQLVAHPDILAERESMRRPLLLSAGLHGILVLTLLIQGFAGIRPRDLWGSPNALGGGSVGITPVKRIPLPSPGGAVNPVANDTRSRVPAPPPAKKQARRQADPDPSAVALKSKSQAKQPTRADATTQRSRLETPQSPGQVYSSTGSQAVSPLLGQTGSGGPTMGPGSVFGNRFGWYGDLLEQRIAGKWRTNDVDPRLRTAPTVIVTFVILRNGSIADPRVEQSSGNRALDNSALRAVYEAAPFPPLPSGFERNDAKVEFWFQLQR